MSEVNVITAVKILLEISDIKHFGKGKLDDTGISKGTP